MIKKDIDIKNAKVLIMGVTFKEDCPDTRNTKVIDLIDELKGLGLSIKTYDPWVEYKNLPLDYQNSHLTKLESSEYDAVILAVAHEQFKNMDIKDIKSLCKPNHIVCDLKYIFPSDVSDMRL